MRAGGRVSTALTAAEDRAPRLPTCTTRDCPAVDPRSSTFSARAAGQVRTQLSIALQGIVTQQLLRP